MTGPEFSEAYARFVARIDSEDALIDNRVQWLLVSQGLLFTAFGFSVSGAKVATGAQHRVGQVLPWLGLATSLLLLLSIVAAFATAAEARHTLQVLYLKSVDEPTRQRHRRLSAYPQASRRSWHFFAGFAAPLLLPVAFAIGWLVLIL